jgi:DNA-binding IclR family transcriptional regulator
MTVLRYLAIGKSADEIAHITGVAKTEVYRKVDELQAEGYVIDDNRLTEKGYDALHWDRRELGPPAPIA